jgi:uncharacterized protein (DUF736 family)
MENKNNSGAIFKNSKKTTDKQPDYQGTVNVNGKEMQVSLWVKESKNGNKYFSAAFQEPFKKDSENKTYSNETKYTPKIEDDGLPF